MIPWGRKIHTIWGPPVQYLATNVGRNFGFHLPRDDRTALGGVQLGLITLSSWHPWEVHVIFFTDFEEK